MKRPFLYILWFKLYFHQYAICWAELTTVTSLSFLSFFLSSQNVVFYDYLDSSAVSSDSPNWQAYLIKRYFLVWLRDHSTHWRATCRYNTDGTVYTDYLRASFEDFEIVRDTPTGDRSCRRYELVNIRGNQCENCTAWTGYQKDSMHLHIDSYYSASKNCDFDGNESRDAVVNEDNFGFYDAVNQKFRCTSSSEATTQFWFGGKWFHKRRTLNIWLVLSLLSA